MRVLHVIPSFAPRYGGPVSATIGLTKELAREGHDVTVMTTNIDGPGVLDVPFEQPVDMDGVEVFYHPVGHPRWYVFSRALGGALRDRVASYDVVHVHSVFQWPTTAAGFWCRRRGVPYIVHAIGSLDPVSMSKSFAPWPTSVASSTKKLLYMQTAGRWDINRATAMHFTSQADMEASRAVGVRTPGYILPLGVEVPSEEESNSEGLRARYPQLKDRKVVLFLGRLDPIKGLDILAEAMGTLARKRDDFALVVAGGGPPDYERRVAAMVEENGIGNSTVMVGQVDGDDKSLLLGESDVFVLPSYHENFPIAVLEAMAAGLPVVVSDQAKIHDKVSDAGAGLVTTLDSTDVARAVDRLLNDAELRDTMGAAGRRLVREELSWEKSAERIVQAYTDILAGGKNAVRADARSTDR